MNGINRMSYAAGMALCLALALAPNARAQRGGDFKAEAAQYLASREPQLLQTDDPNKKLFLLVYLAPAALSAGDSAKATAYARELMALGEELKSRPGFGPGMYADATHVGNLVLGRLALLEGDLGKAKEHLLAAGRVPGSPVLKSFGPTMLLAKELIEKGEREAAIEYFDLCAQFWEMHRERLQGWKEEVKKGGVPDFGPSLDRAFTSWRFAR